MCWIRVKLTGTRHAKLTGRKTFHVRVIKSVEVCWPFCVSPLFATSPWQRCRRHGGDAHVYNKLYKRIISSAPTQIAPFFLSIAVPLSTARLRQHLFARFMWAAALGSKATFPKSHHVCVLCLAVKVTWFAFLSGGCAYCLQHFQFSIDTFKSIFGCVPDSSSTPDPSPAKQRSSAQCNINNRGGLRSDIVHVWVLLLIHANEWFHCLLFYCATQSTIMNTPSWTRIWFHFYFFLIELSHWVLYSS